MFAKKTLVATMTVATLALGASAAGAASVLPARHGVTMSAYGPSSAIRNHLLTRLLVLKLRVQEGIRAAKHDHRPEAVHGLEHLLAEIEQTKAEVRALRITPGGDRAEVVRLIVRVNELQRRVDSELRH